MKKRFLFLGSSVAEQSAVIRRLADVGSNPIESIFDILSIYIPR